MAAWRQANFNATLNEKNAQIIALQHQQIMAVTGGDSYPVITPVFSGEPDINKIIIMQLTNAGDYPLYELRVSIVDQDKVNSLITQYKIQKGALDDEDNKTKTLFRIHADSTTDYIVGTIGARQIIPQLATFDLDEKIGSRNFLIEMNARNGYVQERIGLRWINNSWLAAYKTVSNGKIEVVPKGYPKDQLPWQQSDRLP
jgi:hypothetical protein